MKRPDAFSVQPGIFGKALTDEHGHAARNKVPYCPSISVQVAARKALIRRVKESVVLFREENIRDGRPLFFRGVDACRVVCARMQQEYRALRSTVQRRDEPIKVERDRFGVVIRIRALLDADILEDSEMVGPSRIAQVDHLLFGVPIVPTQEKRTQVVRAGPGDRLYADDTFIGEGWGIGSQYQARRARYEFGEAGDGKVLVIERRIA